MTLYPEVIETDPYGTLFIKYRSKVLIVLFTCAVYRIVHLKFLSNLSTGFKYYDSSDLYAKD